MVVVPDGAEPRTGSTKPGEFVLFVFFAPLVSTVGARASLKVVEEFIPTVSLVEPSTAIGVLLRMANNATGADNAANTATPNASAFALGLLFVLNQPKAPLRRSLLSIFTSKSSFISSIFFIPVV